METIGRDLREMQRVPLQPAHIAAIRAAGTRKHYPKGMMLAEIGAPADRFVYVEEGEIERSEEHTSELQSHRSISYAVFCLRSEERRVGKECTVVCRSRWSPYH